MVENLNWSENLVEKGYVEGRGKSERGRCSDYNSHFFYIDLSKCFDQLTLTHVMINI